MDMTYNEYIEFINHLMLARLDDADYLSFMLQSNLEVM